MRKLAFLFALLSCSAAFAQSVDTYCGSKAHPEYSAWYAAKTRDLSGSRGARAIRWVPVVYHIITETNGNGGMPLREVIQSHCDLNRAYASTGIQFYINDINYINNSQYFAFSSFNTGSQVMNAFNVDNKCNIYINDDPAGVCGYAFFPGSGPNGGGIFVKKSCYGTNSTTLIHEMGHYFGLYHTFEDGFGIEFVNGSNCNRAGDLFCDTPADFISNRWTCPYTGNDTDPNGDPYLGTIDGTYYMSYSNDRCQNRFSPLQENEMYDNLQQLRPSLLGQTLPDTTAYGTANLVQPVNFDTTVDASRALFVWNSVPGATHYIFQIPTSNPSNFWADTIVSDTSVIISGLIRNRLYQYRVKPYSFGFTCASFTTLTSFRTAGLNLNASVAGSTCTGSENGLIQLNPTLGSAPYTYRWNTGDSTSSLNGLSAGTYVVTVTDAAGEILVSTYTLLDPTPLSLSINEVTPGVYLAQVQGGSPGYTYSWSNGSTSDRLINAASGVYQLTVTDQNGCEQTASVNVVSSVTDWSPAVLGVWPNPVKAGERIIIGNTDIKYQSAIGLYSSDGRLVQMWDKWSDKLQLNSGIQAGMYRLMTLGSGPAATGRIMIY